MSLSFCLYIFDYITIDRTESEQNLRWGISIDPFVFYISDFSEKAIISEEDKNGKC